MTIHVLVTRGSGMTRPHSARIVGFDSYEEAEAYCERISPKVSEKHWEMGTIMPMDSSYAELDWPDVLYT